MKNTIYTSLIALIIIGLLALIVAYPVAAKDAAIVLGFLSLVWIAAKSTLELLKTFNTKER